MTLSSFSILCMWRVHDTVVAEKYLLSVIVELQLCSSPKAISEEMSPIDYPQSAVGPDLDIISLFTSASAAPVSSQSRSNGVQEVRLPGHGCVQMWSAALSSGRINVDAVDIQIQVVPMSK